MSLRRRLGLLIGRAAVLAALVAAAASGFAQYVGKVTKEEKQAPELRSIAVVEYTGEEGSPKSSRLVPVAVLDGGELQDGGIYLARPEPLALVPEVEYELEQDGKPVGLFEIKNAGQQDGGWVGFGSWKPLPSSKPKSSAKSMAHIRLDDEDDAQSDEPVLHRKHHADDAPTGAGGSSDSGAQSEPSDPDRPVLHKKTSAGATDSGNSTSTTGGNGPVLHKSDPSGGSGSADTTAQANDDPDRPVLRNPKKSAPAPAASDDAIASTDPDRPRLKRGKSTGDAIEVVPSLKGFPPDVQQVVAVSDAKTRPPHPWNYSWSNPEDEAKMKAAMEDIARTALGLNPPPAKPKPRRTASTATKKAPRPASPAEPVPLDNEQFRVFELAYGSGATLVLSAHTDGPLAQQKFVTLVAQPDLYGNALVLLKNVTDGEHLDEQPRMRLVDAVDALADNRGELLFELRGATQRQFALYRVLRGQAEKLFVTGGGESND